MAAAVFIPPSPHDPLSRMATASRRAPLQSIPNATNSPHRLLTTSGSKRPRAQANVSQQENEPPTKRQATEKASLNNPGPATPSRHIQTNTAEGRVFERGNGTSGSTAFQKKLVAARERGPGLRVTKNVDNSDKESAVRQWQKHYRKIFPTFRFYFDNVGDDIRARFMRHITQLGATEEKFFSKTVTHIITTREIAPEASQEGDAVVNDQPQTINPSLLDKNAALATARSQIGRREMSSNLDILQRGRQMDMKLWSVDKLQRVLTTIIEGPTAGDQNTRPITNPTRSAREGLSQVLRHEKLAATSEREPLALTQDLHYFKGPFLYIHDMNEKYRPTMVREYAKVTKRTDGEWPQFRSAGIGKCPFVEDPAMKREMDQERRRMMQAQRQQESQLPRTRSTVTLEAPKMEPPRRVSPRKALNEVNNPPPPPATVNPGMLNRMSSNRTDGQFSFPPMPDRPTFDFVKPSQLQMTREPAASGIQRSNITSAIQSQVISSTAATGLRASTSKEVHELKRKVLERTHTGSLSIGSIPSSHRMNDLAGALQNARQAPPQRAAKSKAQEKLGGIQEEADPGVDDVAAEKPVHQATKKKRKQPLAKDPKPGYCENCRDKYDDFEEHIISRKHRKFAMTSSNWTELDDLLAKLQRP